MDSLITAAAHALATGDPLGALTRVALRNDAPALALRGIAMAQVGDFDRARTLLRRAARAFGTKEVVARARCVVAEAEVALVSRDLGWPAKTLDAARVTLEAHGDWVNAAHARHLQIRRLLLIGRIDDAERMLTTLDPSPFPPGPNAMLVKETCSKCHSPNVVVTQTFNEKTARKIYQKMLGESPDTERGKKIVEYLYTVLGEKSE